MRSVFAATIGLVLVGGVACTEDDRRTTEISIARFHEQFNAGQFDGIYESASPEFRQATALPDWIKLLESVRGKAGFFVSSSQSAWAITRGTNATTVTMTVTSRFELLMAAEHFSWRIDGSKAQLLGYYIDAPTPTGN